MNKKDLLLEQWKTASELHRHMDNLIWQHFHHFITVNGILLSALAVIWSRITSGAALNQCTLAFASTVVSFFGLNFSVIWYLIHRRQQAYHRYRCDQAKTTEKKLIVDNERVLDLYDKTLGQLNEEDKERLYIGKLETLFPTLSLVLWLPLSLSIAWLIATVYFLALWLRL